MTVDINRLSFVLPDEDKKEIEDELRRELRDINESKAFDALLIQSMAHNWSFSQFVNVAKYRGKSWRFMSTLSDAALEIQGLGMLRLMSKIVGDDLILGTVERAFETVKRLDSMVLRYPGGPVYEQILERAMQQTQETASDVVEDYRNDIRRIRG